MVFVTAIRPTGEFTAAYVNVVTVKNAQITLAQLRVSVEVYNRLVIRYATHSNFHFCVQITDFGCKSIYYGIKTGPLNMSNYSHGHIVY
jgi:hypothetical protein